MFNLNPVFFLARKAFELFLASKEKWSVALRKNWKMPLFAFFPFNFGKEERERKGTSVHVHVFEGVCKCVDGHVCKCVDGHV